MSVKRRNARTETTTGEVRLFLAPDGTEVTLPGIISQTPAFEFTCAKCGAEHTARGLLAAIIAEDPDACLAETRS